MKSDGPFPGIHMVGVHAGVGAITISKLSRSLMFMSAKCIHGMCQQRTTCKGGHKASFRGPGLVSMLEDWLSDGYGAASQHAT